MAAVFAVFTLVMLTAIGAVTWHGANARINERAEDRLKSLTLAARGFVQDHGQRIGEDLTFLAESRAIAEVLASLDARSPADRTHALDHARALMLSFARARDGLSRLALIDTRTEQVLVRAYREPFSGRLMQAETNPTPVADADLAGLQDLTAGHQMTSRVIVPERRASPTGFSDQMEPIVMRFSRAIRDEGGTHRLALILETSFHGLVFSLAGLRVDSGSLMVFDDTGRLLSGHGRQASALASGSDLEALMAVHPDPLALRRNEQVTVLRRFRLHPGSDQILILGAVSDPIPLLARMGLALDRSVLLAAGFLVLGTIMFLVLGAFLLRPLGRLLRDIRMYEPGTGAGALAVGLIDRRDEFGELARDLRVLVVRLEQQIMRARQASNDMRRVFETSIDAKVLVSDAGAIEDINHAAETLFGWRQHELLGRQASVLLVPEDAHALGLEALEAAPIQATLKPPDASRTLTAVLREGEHVPVTVAVNDLQQAGPYRYMVMFHDLRDNLALQNAQSANAAKSRFLANMSHELRTPLNAVTLHAEMIADEAEASDNQALKDDSRDIMAAANHLLDLINGILDLARIESGRMTLMPEPTDLTALTEELRTMGTALARKRGNTFAVVARGLPASVMIDRLRLRQCLINLISNAAKFTDNGTITLQARCDGTDLLFSVTDTGIGMTEQETGRIFEMFEQANTYVRAQRGGSGVGLALTRQIMDLMGGTISVQSRPGEGSRFDIVVPVIGCDISDPKTEGSAPVPIGVRTWTNRATPMVLVVDADTDRRYRHMRALRRINLAPVGAIDTGDALERARAHRPDLALVASADAYQAMATFREALSRHPDIATVPVFGITGSGPNQEEPLLVGLCGRARRMKADGDMLLESLHGCLACGVDPDHPEEAGDPDQAPILVVEDDGGLLHALASAIERAGLSVVRMSDGSDALAWLRATVPALVLLDLSLPGANGFTIIERMRADPRTANVPIRVITGIELTPADEVWLGERCQAVVRKGELELDHLIAAVLAPGLDQHDSVCALIEPKPGPSADLTEAQTS